MNDSVSIPPSPQPAVVAPENRSEQPRRVLITGVTGYVGGRLVPVLLERGHHVRVLVRGRAERLAGRPWYDHIEIAVGDVTEPDSLAPALDGIDVAYYLIHSMSDSHEFHQRDLMAAREFAQACAQAGVERIIYLGGLGDPATELSEHLRSRHETGDALRSAGVPVTEFQAAVIIGSGSLSFEMVRHLTERVPVMICPRWVYTRTQPIAIRNVLSYLSEALETPASSGQIIQIGGADVMTYADMMRGYARQRGLQRLLVPVPMLTPTLSSYWVHLVTPVPAQIARPLIEGLRNEVIVTDDLALRLFPQVEPLDYATAVDLALGRIRDGAVETIWTDARGDRLDNDTPETFVQEQGMLIERLEQEVDASPGHVFQSFCGLGGDRGWPPYHWLWVLRGLMDRMVGGIGLRRNRRHPSELRVGDALDFWRVERVEPDRELLLRAEMKVPGEAWLRFQAIPLPDGRTRLVQTAFFTPHGLFGLLYWYGIYPLHRFVFPGMIAAVAAHAEGLAGADDLHLVHDPR